MGKYIFYFLLVILLPLNARSQEKDSMRLRHIVALTFGDNDIKEENLHPKVSSGSIVELSYGIEIHKKNWQEFQFTIGYSRLKTDLEDVSKSANFILNTGYSYNFNIAQNKKLTYYLGPETSLSYKGCFFPNWDESHLYWANYLSVGLRNIIAVKSKKRNEWVTSISIPIFSVFSRPELYRSYKIDDVDFNGIVSNLHSRITPAHLANVFYFKMNTEYRFPVFERKRQAFSYSIEFLRMKHDDGKPFQQVLSQIGIKFFL